ncbi:MAG: uroporphyrinogen-III C-methyltransferase [Alphaproteobacteria bacterium]
MSALPFALPDFAPGWVWLTGAGPGDPGLLTLLAHHGLGQADVVVYDALVSEAILALARAEAQRVYAGKRGGKPSPTQADISERLIALAREGKRVLRLKGGDPMVFGRGGEEALSLAAAGIPFRIIPGVSAGIGGLAYAGIPLTHRDSNSVVTFLTGHNAAGVVPDEIDWQALARGSPVLVIYMALKHLAVLSERLLAAGRPAEEPVAIVSDATLPTQRVLETTLGRAAADAAAAAMAPPAIVAVGEVVRLRAHLDWLGAIARKEQAPAALASAADGKTSD